MITTEAKGIETWTWSEERGAVVGLRRTPREVFGAALPCPACVLGVAPSGSEEDPDPRVVLPRHRCVEGHRFTLAHLHASWEAALDRALRAFALIELGEGTCCVAFLDGTDERLYFEEVYLDDLDGLGHLGGREAGEGYAQRSERRHNLPMKDRGRLRSDCRACPTCALGVRSDLGGTLDAANRWMRSCAVGHIYAVGQVIEIWNEFFDQVCGALLRSMLAMRPCGIVSENDWDVWGVLNDYRPDMTDALMALADGCPVDDPEYQGPAF